MRVRCVKTCTLQAGLTCKDDTECASGACLGTTEGDSVCCSKSCASGLFCSSDGASCVATEGVQIGCDGDTQIRCQNALDGSGDTSGAPGGSKIVCSLSRAIPSSDDGALFGPKLGLEGG